MPEKSFTAYIIKGNRQVIRREVTASKRFKVEENTYIIKDKSIFLKNIDGIVRSVAYYREGNPNPYDFKTHNTGMTPEELDTFYAEDFHTIVVNLQPKDKSFYILLVTIITLSLAIIFDILGGIKYFIH